jgi:hypothetical protein
MFREAAAETATLSEEVPGDTAGLARGAAAVAATPAWDPAAAEASAVEEEVSEEEAAAADKWPGRDEVTGAPT